MSRRKGYVLSMWTGLFPLNANGCPVLFGSVRGALTHLRRCPSWGRFAVEVRECTVRLGSNGKPDYILGDAVANGALCTRAVGLLSKLAMLPAANDAAPRDYYPFRGPLMPLTSSDVAALLRVPS